MGKLAKYEYIKTAAHDQTIHLHEQEMHLCSFKDTILPLLNS